MERNAPESLKAFVKSLKGKSESEVRELITKELNKRVQNLERAKKEYEQMVKEREQMAKELEVMKLELASIKQRKINI